MRRGEEAGSSPTYRIFETHQFVRDLTDLGQGERVRLEAKLREYVYPLLRQNPRFGPNIKQLRGWDAPTWRYRVGEWRFFYEIDDKRRIVLMTALDHRKEAYR